MNVPEMLLYDAHCDSDGIGEGRFNPDDGRDFARKRYRDALKSVYKYIEMGWCEEGLRNLFPEEEAGGLVDFCRENFEGSEAFIKLFESKHGRILFQKKIRFPGYDLSQIPQIISILERATYFANKPAAKSVLPMAFSGGLY